MAPNPQQGRLRELNATIARKREEMNRSRDAMKAEIEGLKKERDQLRAKPDVKVKA